MSDTNPVVAAVDSATVIEIGDLLWQDTDDAKPASIPATDVGDLVEEAIHDTVVPTDLQEVFAQKFLGVAMEPSSGGDTAPVRVATTGVFEFDCPSEPFELGDLVGADSLTHPRVCLADQQVAKVNDSKYAIARVAKRERNAVSSVLVDIRSRVMGISI